MNLWIGGKDPQAEGWVYLDTEDTARNYLWAHAEEIGQVVINDWATTILVVLTFMASDNILSEDAAVALYQCDRDSNTIAWYITRVNARQIQIARRLRREEEERTKEEPLSRKEKRRLRKLAKHNE